jgi:hypothetical protein
MIAKFKVTNTDPIYSGSETLTMMAVTSKPFDAEGASEDNSFARWTPMGELKMTVNNPSLIGQFKAGDEFYLTFTKVEKS